MEKQRWEEPEKRREEREEKGREAKRREAKRSEEKTREDQRRPEKTREDQRREDQRREEERRPEKRKSHKEEVSVGRKGRKVVFPMICGSGGSKVGAPKQRARSHLARWEMKKCTPLWREAHVEAKMNKARHSRTTFGSCDVEEVHAVVARSTCPSQNATKHTMFGPLLEVEMSEKCTPLWREAHAQVEMYKALQCRTALRS